MTEEEIHAWITFSTVPDMGLEDAVRLLGDFGSPGAVLDSSLSELRHAVTDELARRIASGPEDEQAEVIEKTEDWLRRTSGSFVISIADEDFPRGLFETGCSPLVLYGLGDRKLLRRRLLAILGTRHPSAEGERDAYEFGAALEKVGLTLLSSMMEGVEAASLRGALADPAGAAVVLCASPLNRVYPASLKPIMMKTAKQGLLLSATPIGESLTPERLELRYRYLAGTADAVLLMEASAHSKAIPVAKTAGSYGRDTLAVPGNIHLPLSKGPNRLIRSGARLVESVQDIAGEIRGLSERIPRLSDDLRS